MKWYLISFRASASQEHAKPHICSERTVELVSRSLAQRGFPEAKREEGPGAYFWYPHPAFASPAVVSFEVKGLPCAIETAMYDTFLQKARTREVRHDLPIPSVKYHLPDYCLVLTEEEQEAFLQGIQGHYAEAIALAEVENRAWNAIKLPGDKAQLNPRPVGRVPILEG
jgi:hypothetical protein